MTHRPGTGEALRRRYSLVDRLYADIHEWTGIDVGRLLADGSQEELARVTPLCQAAVVTALHDVLAEHGVHPRHVTGLSLGGVIAAGLSGAMSRPEFFSLMAVASEAEQSKPLPPGTTSDPTAGAVAVCTIPYDTDPVRFCAELGIEDLYLVADSGPADATRRKRRITAGGPRKAVDAFLAALPPGTKAAVWETASPPHSPLRRKHVEEVVDPILDRMTFRDPVVPVLSCLDDRTLTTADEIRALLRENHLRTAHVPYITSGLEREPIETYLMLGPSMMSSFVASPLPSYHVETPEHIEPALQMLHEMEIETASNAMAEEHK